MDGFEYIKTRICFLESKIELLHKLKIEEMAKSMNERDSRLLNFVWKENCVYTHTLTELKKLLTKFS